MNKKQFFIIIVFLAVLLSSLFLALLSGLKQFAWQDTLPALFDRSHNAVLHDILWKIRAPRVFWALIIGAGLSVCGVVIQSLVHNPLAEPYTLGISGAASLGASVIILLGGSASLVSLAAFISCALVLGLLLALLAQQKLSKNSLLLCGVVLSVLFSSLVMLLFSLMAPNQLQKAIFWLMGDLSGANSFWLIPTSLIIALLSLWLWLKAPLLNALALGDQRAKLLGLELRQSQALLLCIVCIITTCCIASAGIIGFVGLIVPHIVRLLGGANHHYVLPASFLLGASFLALSDTLARTVMAPLQLPVGVITGIIGGLTFLGLLISQKQGVR